MDRSRPRGLRTVGKPRHADTLVRPRLSSDPVHDRFPIELFVGPAPLEAPTGASGSPHRHIHERVAALDQTDGWEAGPVPACRTGRFGVAPERWELPRAGDATRKVQGVVWVSGPSAGCSISAVLAGVTSPPRVARATVRVCGSAPATLGVMAGIPMAAIKALAASVLRLIRPMIIMLRSLTFDLPYLFSFSDKFVEM